jgi:hypothetical protein
MPTEEPVAAHCASHPAVETYLRCGRCETPICPRCMIMTPVGARCRGCARLKKLPMFELRPRDYLRGLLGGASAAAFGAVVLASIPARGFFSWLLMLLLGYVVGQTASRAANGKRGNSLAVVAALAVPVGMVLGQVLLLLLLSRGPGVDLGAALVLTAADLVLPAWDALVLVATMAVAFSRVR